MATHDTRIEEPGFVPFFRSYTRTWVHAVATAGLTAFGTLTFVDHWFAVLAIASYVVPPIALYVRTLREHERNAVGRSADGHDRPTAAASRGERGWSSETSPRRGSDAPLHSTASATATGKEGDSAPASETSSVAESGVHDEHTRGEGRDTAGDRGDDYDDYDEGTDHSDEGPPPSWTPLETPVPDDASLVDVVVAGSDAVYAVGSGGLVAAEVGGEWTTPLETGPGAQGNDLRGIDATDDGGAVWIAGEGGAVGRIDTETGRHVDYTAPAGRTDTLLDIAVGGSVGDETVLLGNGSGEILRGRYVDGDLSWDDPTTPGSGSSLAALVLVDASLGYCCDTNDGVFETDDGGESFTRVGLEGADGTLEGVATASASASERGCLVTADDGVVHRYDGGTWTPERVTDAALTGIDCSAERAIVSAGDGTIHERTGTGPSGWSAFETDASGPLHAVSVGDDRAVAVADGTVLERS
ncbi:WD40/YVTN/BNR-like repeat-containing protein [Halobiforma nitratireducens]|uniref:Uncharacterized protein n=1 Tax=Halobiforma nitratireducens JCM 10879 TaxID=1227454 RepID=M0LMH7_9EURY|nr:hypothetical protein [Halobiforma nitratireducens]EMA33230.1 hypothetical protein C446_14589 [Halobiforma nitratireducens JCM 10879]